MLDEESRDLMDKSVTKDNILAVLIELAKGKSPSPYGWTMELYLHFQDIMLDELTEMVESYRVCWVSRVVNSTFITLIPKVLNPSTFSYFHPMSLCNSIYNLISKTIIKQIKPTLSKFISKKHFDFFLVIDT